MFRFIAIVLAGALCLPAADVNKADIRAIALSIPAGALVRIKTTDRQTIRGKLTAISAEGVTLQLLENNRIVERTAPFSSMKSIQETNRPLTAGKAVLIFFGVMFGLAYLIGGIVSAVN